jgi:hypothetical protein
MKLRFQADADLRQAIVDGCLRRFAGMDFQRAGTVPLEGLIDPVVLELAALQGRVLVSHDGVLCHGRSYPSGSTSGICARASIKQRSGWGGLVWQLVRYC